jgi:protein tyrosine/serine phosphatase
MRIWVVVCVVILIALTNGDGRTDTILNFHQVKPWLYRGGRPRQGGIIKLKEMDIRVIINLERELFEQEPREVKKESDWAKKANIKFEHIPMHPICVPKKQEVEKALVVLTDPVNHPIFIHCDRGSDRTGIVIAAYRIWFEGWTLEQGYEEMKKYGHRSILLFWWKNLLYKIKEV